MNKNYNSHIKIYAIKLITDGLSYSAISRKLNINRSTISYWHNPTKFKNNHKKYRLKNRYKIYKKCKEWKNQNRCLINENKRYFYQKYKNDPLFKLRNNLHKRMSKMVRRNQTSGRAVKDLGCSLEALKFRFEFFYPQFKWEDYGKIWSIDHIKPLSSFDLTDIKEFEKAANFANLQPLTISDNSKKGNKIM